MTPRLSQFLPVFTDIRRHRKEGKLTAREYHYFLVLLPEAKVQGGTGVVWINDPLMGELMGMKADAVRKVRRSLESKRYIRNMHQLGSRGKYPLVIHKWPLTRIPKSSSGLPSGVTSVELSGDISGLPSTNIPIGVLRVNAWSDATSVSNSGDVTLDTLRALSGHPSSDLSGLPSGESSGPLLRPLETLRDLEEKDIEPRQAELFDSKPTKAPTPKPPVPAKRKSKAVAKSTDPDQPKPKDVLTIWDQLYEREFDTKYTSIKRGGEASLASKLITAIRKDDGDWQRIPNAIQESFRDDFCRGKGFSVFASQFSRLDLAAKGKAGSSANVATAALQSGLFEAEGGLFDD